jgi:hypothetical protein
MAEKQKISFAAFFLLWAEFQGWTVPAIHIAVCHFLENCTSRVRVLRIFRGCGKSTILGVYNAWLYYCDAQKRILHQGSDDKTAFKTSRDVKNILQKHPLTRNLGATLKGSVEFWWSHDGYLNDPRNPSMQAAGITSNITSSRADYIQNDDVEVLKNVQTEEAREKVRNRLSEQVHIAVPGAQKDFIGTPHTFDSLYDEKIEGGAVDLTIRLYEKEQRFEKETGLKTQFLCKFVPEYVFVGIGKYSWVAREGEHYTMKGQTLVFKKPPGATVDIYAHCAWPERFDHDEMAERRRECNTLNEWDSQYQLHAKPITDLSLDPEKIIPYDVKPIIRSSNKIIGMWLGKVQIVGATAHWDCSSGRIGRDSSAFSVVLTDHLGRLYLHVCKAVYGNIDEQCKQIREIVIELQLNRVSVETNGIGGHVPHILRKHLKNTGCGVHEHHETSNKNKRILDAWEAPLDSGYLWASMEVLEGDLWDEMTNWNPKVKEQPDGHVDSGARAIADTPVRIGNIAGKPTSPEQQNWRPNQGSIEVATDYDRRR